MKGNLALIKLGGSVVTLKDRPVSPNNKAIDGISRAMNLVKEIPIILVHGGGSFGHYWSTKYDMHTKPDNYDIHGISIVHESMVNLNQIIVNSLVKNGSSPYAVSGFALTNGKYPLAMKIKQLRTMAQTGLLPITFGDVIHISNGKYSVLSGDVIMTMIAKVLTPDRVIFAVNTDGVYSNKKNRETIREITSSDIRKIRLFQPKPKSPTPDITGGMVRKVKEALKISSKGLDVMIVNGLKPDRMIKALQFGPECFEGTVIKAQRRLKIEK